jgi:SNF2 family DNA or RNA helicase
MNNIFKLQSTLMTHQSTGVQKADGMPAFAYMCDMGVGKTLMLLAEYQSRISKDDIMDLLVIAPKGCIRNWYMDREDNPSELTKHLDPTLLKHLVVASSEKGAAARDAREILLKETRKPRALFINVESLSGTARMEAVCKEFLSSGRALMAIDESTVIKSRKAQRTQTILKLGKLAKVRRILSGLATPKSPMDLHAQFSFLDESILGKSFTLFRARYARMDFICRAPNNVIDAQLQRAIKRSKGTMAQMRGLSRGEKISLCYALGGWIPDTAPIIAGYQRLPELRDRISKYCYRVLKEDCLDLPPKVFVYRDVDLTDEQRRIYKEVKEDATALLAKDKYVTTKNAMDQILRLHQVCCGHTRVDETGEFIDIPSNRISTVLEVLEDHERKAIIWATYQREIEKITAALQDEYGKDAVATYYGGNAKDRGDDETRFKTDARCRFMVATPASGGLGLNWQVANLVIYAANGWDLAQRLQSEDRTHRKGQTESVTYVDITTRGTVEEKIIRALRNKMDLSTTLTGEQLRKWLV